MKDVGAVAGVSVQTVSRVLNGHPHVSAATRLAVEQAVSDLSYCVNAGARILASGRSTLVGVLVDETGSDGMEGELVGAAQRAGRLAVPIRVSPATAAEAVSRLLELSVACVVTCVSDEVLGAFRTSMAHSCFIVAMGPGGHDLDQHRSADADLAFAATRDLVQEGHRTVWFVSDGAASTLPTGWGQGWSRAVSADGAPPPLLPGDGTVQTGQLQGRLLARITGVTAVLVAGNDAATGVTLGLAERGLSVPDDVAVVGLDHNHHLGRLPLGDRAVGGDRRALADAAVDAAVAGSTKREWDQGRKGAIPAR